VSSPNRRKSIEEVDDVVKKIGSRFQIVGANVGAKFMDVKDKAAVINDSSLFLCLY
jgi:hypothetical protein